MGRNTPPYIGIGQSRPRLGWRFTSGENAKNWIQAEYELQFKRSSSENSYSVKSEQSVDVPWPEKEESLTSREKVVIRVRAKGKECDWTAWHEENVEAALLSKDDWKADVISTDILPPSRLAKRPFYTRTAFTLDQKALDEIKSAGGARVYATALGVYKLELNGKAVGDHVLAPGWQTYHHRLHYQTYVVPADQFRVGDNVLGAIVGEGWYAGRITWAPELRNFWGEEIGVRVQLETPSKTITTNKDWEWSYGPILSSELYDGETYDAGLIDPSWSSPSKGHSTWRKTKTIPMNPKTNLIAPEAPPIRETNVLKPKEVITSPKGKTIIDFGQNVSGWVRIPHLPANPHEANDHFLGSIKMRFAEVLDKGEIEMRPLRSAKATDQVFLSGKAGGTWEPSFTTHGFRYVEVTGTKVDYSSFEAVVVHSDLERLGDFGCDHELINKLHANVVWGLRGNFVGLPTDCPQRDER